MTCTTVGEDYALGKVKKDDVFAYLSFPHQSIWTVNRITESIK